MLLVQMQKLHRVVSVDKSISTEAENIATYFRVLRGITEFTKHEGITTTEGHEHQPRRYF